MRGGGCVGRSSGAAWSWRRCCCWRLLACTNVRRLSVLLLAVVPMSAVHLRCLSQVMVVVQVKSLTKEYAQELERIEQVFMQERQQLLDATQKEWETAMTARHDREVQELQDTQTRVDEAERQLEHLRVSDEEEYNQIKRKLESGAGLLACFLSLAYFCNLIACSLVMVFLL